MAETTFIASKAGNHRRVRVVVRRTRLSDPHQAQLWPDWRYHTFATNTELSPIAADAYHRAHARAELAIRDLKAHAGLSHCPSGNFYANAAWLSCAVLAHNIYRWIQSHTRPVGQTLTNGNTVRTRLFRLPGRIVNHGRKLILRPPHQMAMGRPLPHHPHQHPQAAPTLLTRLAQHNEPPKHRPQGSTRPHTLQTQPHTPNKPAEPPQNPHIPSAHRPITPKRTHHPHQTHPSVDPG